MVAVPSGRALQYDVKQVSDDAVINRDPSIGDANLIAWITVNTNIPGMTRVSILRNGQRQSIDNPDGGTSSVKPSAHSNSLAWVGVYTNALGDLSTRISEVPWRDEGGATELRALYSFAVGTNNNLVMVPSATGVQYRASFVTNEQGVIALTNIPEQVSAANEIRRHPSGPNEILFWTTGVVRRLTHDSRDDLSPSIWGDQVAWQKARDWPFGWEVFYWKNGTAKQLSTNFYYDMGAKVHGHQVVWYGWDGHDFEIYRYDYDKDAISQITSNSYDDVAPVICNGEIAWEGFRSAEADIYLYHDTKDANGNPIKAISKISDNPEDDINPRIWNGKVVWQGFDGDDFEIYYYDGVKTRKITANSYDDTNPDIRDGIVTWQGYKDNWDAEIFAWDITADPSAAMQITDNDDEDHDPHTADGRIVWQYDSGGKSRIMLASPK